MFHLHLFSHEQVWGNLNTEKHPYSPLAARAGKSGWDKVRSRKFASDVTIDNALEYVEYVWFTNDRVMVILSRILFSPAQRNNRISEILFFAPVTRTDIPPQRPELVLLAHDSSSCTTCSEEICAGENMLNVRRGSLSDLNFKSSCSNGSCDSPCVKMSWEERMRVIYHGNRRGLLSLYYFGAGDFQGCTVRQPYLSSCANQDIIGHRIRQHLSNLLSKLHHQDSDNVRSLGIDRTGAPPTVLTTKDEGPAAFSAEFSQSPVSFTPSPSNVAALPKDAVWFEPPSTKLPSSDDHAVQKSCGDAKGSCCPELYADSEAKCGSNSVECSTKLEQSHVTVSTGSIPILRSGGDPYSRDNSMQNSVCGPDKAGKECECSAENMPDPSLALILNSRRDRPVNPLAEMSAFIGPIMEPGMGNTTSGRGLTMQPVQSIGHGSADRILGDEESNGLGNLGGSMRFESQSPQSAGLGGNTALPSPLPLPSLIPGEPPMKRPRAESNQRPDSFGLGGLEPAWPTPLYEQKAIQLPPWQTPTVPDRPLSALGRALGVIRSPSPLGLTANARKTSSPPAMTPSVTGLGFPRSLNQETEIHSSFESNAALADEASNKQQTRVTNGHRHLPRQRPKRDRFPVDESRNAGECAGTIGSEASSGNGVSCEICGIRFAKRSNKMRHVLTVHNRLKQFECELCGQKFGLKADLGRHRYRIHESRAFSCSKCGKSFAEDEQLELHIRVTHEEDSRPWECKQCRIRFGRKSSLTRHEQTVHQRTRFTCRVCSKTYSQKFDAIRHERKAHGLNAPSE